MSPARARAGSSIAAREGRRRRPHAILERGVKAVEPRQQIAIGFRADRARGGGGKAGMGVHALVRFVGGGLQSRAQRLYPHASRLTKLSSTILRPALSKSTVSLAPSVALTRPGPNF